MEKNKNVFKNTYLPLSLKVSVAVQVISMVIQFFPMFMNVPPAYMILKQLLFLENVVQVIQGSFYAWLVYNIKNETNITSKRYMDWAITTPIMLITLICYMIFLRTSNENIETMQTMQTMQDIQKTQKQIDIFSILRENSAVIITIVILNATMLLFGYLGEINVIPVIWGILIGFIPFIIYYYLIYNNFVKIDTNTNTMQSNINTTILKLFLYFLFFWSLYGLIGFLPYYIKNTLYNIIDLFSKNFFGILLSYLIFTNSVKK